MKWVILDRDGVINVDSPHYIKSAAEWQPIPGSIEAIAALSQSGFRVTIASNQSGIGRHLFDYDAFAAMNQKLQSHVAERGGRIDAFAFAPEHPEHASPMRKPAPGMLCELSRRLGASLQGVWFIGDSLSDLAAAQAAGAVPILVRTGNGAQSQAKATADGVRVFDDLAAAVAALLAQTAAASVGNTSA